MSAPSRQPRDFVTQLLQNEQRAVEKRLALHQGPVDDLTRLRDDLGQLIVSRRSPLDRLQLGVWEKQLETRLESIDLQLARLDGIIASNPLRAQQLARLKARLILEELQVSAQLARVERLAMTPSAPSFPIAFFRRYRNPFAP